MGFLLSDNLIECGCSLAWLVRNPQFLSRVTDGTCVNGGFLQDLDPDDFQHCVWRKNLPWNSLPHRNEARTCLPWIVKMYWMKCISYQWMKDPRWRLFMKDRTTVFASLLYPSIYLVYDLNVDAEIKNCQRCEANSLQDENVKQNGKNTTMWFQIQNLYAALEGTHVWMQACSKAKHAF